jgi:dTDP-glucose 4,6-dehydratase
MNKRSKILVTGADGFIGSHLVEHLLKNNYKVTAFCYYNSFNSPGWLKDIPDNLRKRLTIVMGDIRDPFLVNKIVNNYEYIFHLAALISIPYSYEAFHSYTSTNINGTLNILNACKNNKIKRLIVASSSEVYGSALYTPINESHPLQAQSPYSATKIASDNLSFSFFKSFNIPIVIARPFNTYGPRQSERAIIPTIISQMLRKNEIQLGSINPIRDFNYVSDTVDGLFKLMITKNIEGQIFNICSGKGYKVSEIFNYLKKYINPRAYLKKDKIRIRPTNSEVNKLIGCNKKIKKYTDWKNKITVSQGLSKTIDWYLKSEKTLNQHKENYQI